MWIIVVSAFATTRSPFEPIPFDPIIIGLIQMITQCLSKVPKLLAGRPLGVAGYSKFGGMFKLVLQLALSDGHVTGWCGCDHVS